MTAVLNSFSDDESSHVIQSLTFSDANIAHTSEVCLHNSFYWSWPLWSRTIENINILRVLDLCEKCCFDRECLSLQTTEKQLDALEGKEIVQNLGKDENSRSCKFNYFRNIQSQSKCRIKQVRQN